MRCRAVMPATSNASSGDSFHCVASMAARITTAICSTGAAATPRIASLSLVSSQPAAKPRSKEPLTTRMAPAAAWISSSLQVGASAAASTRQALMVTMVNTQFAAVVISRRSVTWPRGRISCTRLKVMTGDVDIATAPARAADTSGKPIM